MFFVRLLVVVVVVLVVVLAVQSAYGRVISQPGGHIRPGLSPGSLAAVQNCEITYQVNCASETCSSVASVADISVILLEDLNPRLNCSVPFIDIGEILCIQNSIKTLLSTPSVTFRTPRYFSATPTYASTITTKSLPDSKSAALSSTRVITYSSTSPASETFTSLTAMTDSSLTSISINTALQSTVSISTTLSSSSSVLPPINITAITTTTSSISSTWTPATSETTTISTSLSSSPSISTSETVPSTSTSSTTAPTSSSTLPSYPSEEAATIHKHNAYRAQYSIPPVSWSSFLAAEAYDYAAVLAFQHNCALIHAGVPGEGENLTMYGASDVSAGIMPMQDSVDGWMTEDPYGYNHASQVLWRSTTEIGCGKVINFNADGSFCLVVVCRYVPQGNILGQTFDSPV